MFTTDMMQLPFMLLAAIAVGAVVYAAIFPFLSRGRGKRTRGSTGVTESGKTAHGPQGPGGSGQRTPKSGCGCTFKELEDKQKAKEKVPLRLRLQRAGLDISVRDFWIASAICGLVLGMLAFVVYALDPADRHRRDRVHRWIRFAAMVREQEDCDAARTSSSVEFANAIDVIVRGVKSGLPLNECLGIIARESPSPVREEFQDLVEQQRVGIPLTDAFERMMGRVPLAEVKFFAIVIGIPAQAGGNLSEALGNLSGVLRDRKMLAAKVQGDVVGSEGLGVRSGLAADHRDGSRVHDLRPITSCSCSRPKAACSC